MLLHKTYKGIVNRTGVGTMFDSVTKYSVIQIDKDIITDVRISHKLDSFLDVGEYVEITVTRMPMTFFKVIVVLKKNNIQLKDKSLYLFAVWMLGLIPFYLSKGEANLHLFTIILGSLLAFEMLHFISALYGRKNSILLV